MCVSVVNNVCGIQGGAAGVSGDVTWSPAQWRANLRKIDSVDVSPSGNTRDQLTRSSSLSDKNKPSDTSVRHNYRLSLCLCLTRTNRLIHQYITTTGSLSVSV